MNSQKFRGAAVKAGQAGSRCAGKSNLVSIIIILCSLTLLPLSTLAKSTGAYWQSKIITQSKYVDDYFEKDKYGREKINIFVAGQPIATMQESDIYFNLVGT